jgi:hypothetical protein
METAPTCFGLQGNHHQGATASTSLKLHTRFNANAWRSYRRCQCYGCMVRPVRRTKQWTTKHIETFLKRNLVITETCLYRKHFTAWKIQYLSTYIKWKLPGKEKFFPFYSVIGRFQHSFCMYTYIPRCVFAFAGRCLSTFL